jgi:hypothetical protein
MGMTGALVAVPAALAAAATATRPMLALATVSSPSPPVDLSGLLAADAVVFLLVGLLAGAHCLGMCGPLVSVYADRLREREGTEALTVRQVRGHALFNLGRAASYAAVGAAFALVGRVAADAFGEFTTLGTYVRGVTGLVVGVAIVGTGAAYVAGDHRGLALPGPLARVTGRLTAALTRRVDALVGGVRIVGLGAVHGLLPCPVIYPAYLYAFALADPVRAALLLGLLGLGTIPTLFAYGTLLGSLSPARRASLHRALGVSFLLLGYLPLSHGLMLLGVHVPHPHVPFYGPLG